MENFKAYPGLNITYPAIAYPGINPAYPGAERAYPGTTYPGLYRAYPRVGKSYPGIAVLLWSPDTLQRPLKIVAPL
jgi:hypothetical protein